MRLRDITVYLICIVTAVSLLFFAGSRLDYINAQRMEMKLITNEPLDNAPPSLAFATVAMGAFRGLVVDILWMRAEHLKEQGQFFDARQLAEWITTLQPRFAAVWDFHAWNMAYNISVAIPETQPEERWRWVRNGYELLRDQGIEVNPKSVLLHRQLGFIFQHKIGGLSDDVHRYYKLQLADAMEPLLTPVGKDYTQAPPDNAYFDALVDAPKDLESVKNDANYSPLIDALAAADKAFTDDDKLVSNYLTLRRNPTRFAQGAFEVIDSFRTKPSLEKFDVFARAYYLRNTWKLEPVLMRELNQTYGPTDWDDPNSRLPLDWRHPHVHAIYWATKGLQVAEGKIVLHTDEHSGHSEIDYSPDEINADRMIYHSLQDLFRTGTIHIWEGRATVQSASSDGQQEVTREIFLRPDLRMFEPYEQATLMIIQKYEDPNDKEDTSHEIGHRNMLKNAVLSFYQAGHRRQARRIFNRMKKLYPRREFNVPIGQFVEERFRDELKTLDIVNAREMILMTLREAYFEYAIRNDTEASNKENLARKIYNVYNEQWQPDIRIDLPELSRMRFEALQDFLDDHQYPETFRKSLLGRIRIERPELLEELREQIRQLNRESSPETSQ